MKNHSIDVNGKTILINRLELECPKTKNEQNQYQQCLSAEKNLLIALVEYNKIKLTNQKIKTTFCLSF